MYRTITIEDDVTVSRGQSPQLRANESISLKQNFHAKAGSGFHAKWTDEATASSETIDDNSTFQYDAIGNLIADGGEGTNISWTPYGKVRSVTHNDGTIVNYRYDATGNRVEKRITSSGGSINTTRYVRDASGNVLAIYENDQLSEQPIYGSSRLGTYAGQTTPGQRQLGHRKYELSNHLGNVLTVITDNVNLTQDSAWATVVSTQDVYPFGLEMNGRGFNSGAYRYRLPGYKRKDTGFGGSSATVYDYGFRIYRPSIGKFLSVDPLADQFSGWSPYTFGLDNPIRYIDPDGAAPFDATGGDPCPGCQVAMQQLGREVDALQRKVDHAYYKVTTAVDNTVTAVSNSSFGQLAGRINQAVQNKLGIVIVGQSGEINPEGLIGVARKSLTYTYQMYEIWIWP